MTGFPTNLPTVKIALFNPTPLPDPLDIQFLRLNSSCTMILHDDILNGVSCQQKMFERAALILHKFPFRFLSKFSKESFERSYNPQGMVFYYSKRFPKMMLSTKFYEDISDIAQLYFTYYQSRWVDFNQLNVEPSANEPAVPWINRPVNTPITDIQTPNVFDQTVNCNNNNNQINCLNNQTVQVPNKPVASLVSTPSSVESMSVSSSPLQIVEPVASIKVLTRSKKKKIELNKLPEENNNKVHVIDEDDIKIGNISSVSDTIDEKAVSYAEIMKHPSKPLKTKQFAKPESRVEEFKRGESVKSNRIPPSKKVSIKLPDAPFLPNNQHCAFCKNNGEEESVYRTHFVKDESGNVKCPFLSMYTCPNCKATGIKAHTISRCPLSNKNRNIRFNK